MSLAVQTNSIPLLGSPSQMYNSYLYSPSRRGESSSSYDSYDRTKGFDYRDGDTDASSIADRSSFGFGGGGECCPLVVDPLAFLAILTLIAIGTFCLNTYITRNMAAILMAATGGRRKRRGVLELDTPQAKLADVFWHGESLSQLAHNMEELCFA